MLPTDRKAIGLFLKTARERAGLTQAEVATEFGYTSSQFISNIERGAATVPTEVMVKLVRIYRMKPEKFVRIYLEGQERLLRSALDRPGKNRR